jgi:hypothetical protein
MYLIKNIDLCFGEFDRSYLTYGTIIESMCMAKPVIHHRIDSLYADNYDQLYPMYHAETAEDISLQIERAFFNPSERIQMGLAAKEWVKNYFINRSLKSLISILEEPVVGLSSFI